MNFDQTFNNSLKLQKSCRINLRKKKILAYLRGAAELMCQGKYLDDLMLIVLLISTTLLLLVTMI